MCVAVESASFGLTAVAGWRAAARRTHCLLYGNEPDNTAGVPNAIILHVPLAAGAILTRSNFIPTAGCGLLLADMWEACPKMLNDRVTRGLTYGAAPERASVSVFTMGSYTWVAATRADAYQISAALATVPEERRPHVSGALIDFYRRTWPDDALAIGCFSRSAHGQSTEPACIEYPPQDWDVLRMPSTDAHGHVPEFGVRVPVNHRLIVGTDEFGRGGRVSYQGRWKMDPRLALALPKLVVGAEISGYKLDNGDFYVDFSRFGQDGDGRFGYVHRASGPRLTARAEQLPALMA